MFFRVKAHFQNLEVTFYLKKNKDVSNKEFYIYNNSISYTPSGNDTIRFLTTLKGILWNYNPVAPLKCELR